MNPLLTVSGLVKRFPGAKARALDDVSFSVSEGEIFGLLGHNGAGKSTALGIMLGLVHPDAGEVVVDGADVIRDHAEALSKTGAIFEAPAFYSYLSGWENLRLLTQLSGFRDDRAMKETVELVGIADRVHSKVETYSHGMRQRLALAQALLPEPKLLLLDEPTDGLDPEGIHEFRDLVLLLRREKGLTILLNSHLLAEVELYCDRFAILRKGRLVHEGAVGDHGGESDLVELEAEPAEAVGRVVAEVGGAVLAGGLVRLPEGVAISDLVTRLVGAGVRIDRVSPKVATLEDFYLEISEADERERGAR